MANSEIEQAEGFGDTERVLTQNIIYRFSPPTLRQQPSRLFTAPAADAGAMEANFTAAKSDDRIMGRLLELVEAVAPDTGLEIRRQLAKETPPSIHREISISLSPSQFLAMVAHDPVAREHCDPFRKLSRTPALEAQWTQLLAQYGVNGTPVGAGSVQERT